eukprot:scaffold15971_cov76-Phaeocystis_antarctica.AAC.10
MFSVVQYVLPQAASLWTPPAPARRATGVAVGLCKCHTAPAVRRPWTPSRPSRRRKRRRQRRPRLVWAWAWAEWVGGGRPCVPARPEAGRPGA